MSRQLFPRATFAHARHEIVRFTLTTASRTFCQYACGGFAFTHCQSPSIREIAESFRRRRQTRELQEKETKEIKNGTEKSTSCFPASRDEMTGCCCCKSWTQENMTRSSDERNTGWETQDVRSGPTCTASRGEISRPDNGYRDPSLPSLALPPSLSFCLVPRNFGALSYRVRIL